MNSAEAPDRLPDDPNGQNPGEENPKLEAPIQWRLRKMGMIVVIPVVVILIVLGYVYIPISQADYQQHQLASAFFKQCKSYFHDTSFMPREPEELLQEAEDSRKIKSSAITSWEPQVSSQIRSGYWYARIQFTRPRKLTLEERIGPATNDPGYDAPPDKTSVSSDGGG